MILLIGAVVAAPLVGPEAVEASALSAYHAAVRAFDAGDSEARESLARLIDERPGTHGAHRALQFMRRLAHHERGAAAEADFLLGVASRLLDRVQAGDETARDTCMETLVEAVRIRLTDLNDAKSAARILATATASAGKSHWADDALFWRARALATLGDHGGALALYRRLVGEREASWFVGSYDSVFFDDALFAIGETLEAMGRDTDAVAAYRTLLNKTPASRFADDARFREAVLAGRRGDRASLRAFLARHPDSRHAAEARRLLAKP